ncbi:MAG: cyanophycinase [Firmicutes bacterium]|nr:cyanophycinase [Bacillota bacterium]
MGDKVRGTLVIIGGGEDKDGERTVLREFLRFSGSEGAQVVIVTAAAARQRETGALYRRIFLELGAKGVSLLNVDEREEAFRSENLRLLEEATAIFFTGGDQLRITSLLGGTPLYRALQEAYEAGVVIAGTSAGASAMSDTMIISGGGDDSPKKNTVQMAPGMGLLEEVVIDQHFAQRGRIGRLLSAVAQNPYFLGVGIDEDTAILVDRDARFRVIGSQTVTVVDARNVQHTNASEQEPDRPLALTGVLIHILPSGYGFDLKERRPVLPG